MYMSFYNLQFQGIYFSIAHPSIEAHHTHLTHYNHFDYVLCHILDYGRLKILVENRYTYKHIYIHTEKKRQGERY